MGDVQPHFHAHQPTLLLCVLVLCELDTRHCLQDTMLELQGFSMYLRISTVAAHTSGFGGYHGRNTSGFCVLRCYKSTPSPNLPHQMVSLPCAFWVITQTLSSFMPACFWPGPFLIFAFACSLLCGLLFVWILDWFSDSAFWICQPWTWHIV